MVSQALAKATWFETDASLEITLKEGRLPPITAGGLALPRPKGQSESVSSQSILRGLRLPCAFRASSRGGAERAEEGNIGLVERLVAGELPRCD